MSEFGGVGADFSSQICLRAVLHPHEVDDRRRSSCHRTSPHSLPPEFCSLLTRIITSLCRWAPPTSTTVVRRLVSLLRSSPFLTCGSSSVDVLQGDGDSEIALVVEDGDLIKSTMDGQPYMAARFAASLRRRLYRRTSLSHLPPTPTSRPSSSPTSHNI